MTVRALDFCVLYLKVAHMGLLDYQAVISQGIGNSQGIGSPTCKVVD